MFFFFKQKTAYEIYQCDWSSDVCSSDLFDLPLTAIDTMPTLAAARIDSWTEILDVLVRELRGGITDHYYYRPLTLISYTLDQLVWGGATWGFHLTDVVLHALAAVAVLGLARIAVDLPRAASMAVATLFLIHPATIEVVPAIARRQEPLLVIGFCLAIIGARRMPERIGWLLVVLGSLIAVTSVERGLAVPILVFGYLVLYRLAGAEWRARFVTSARWTMPSVLVSVAFFGLRWMLYGSAGAWFRLVHFIQIPMQFGLWLVYPQQVFNLVSPQGLVDKALFLATALVLVVVFGYPVLRAPRRTVLWCGLSWIVSYVLLLSYAGILNPWYVYTAVPGFALIIVFFATEAQRLIVEAHGVGVRAGFAGLAAVILTLALLIPSPVFRDYPAWRVSGELSERFLDELTRLSADVSVHEPLVIINLPAHFRESDTDYLVTRSAAILWPSSVAAWRKDQKDPPEILLTSGRRTIDDVEQPIE